MIHIFEIVEKSGRKIRLTEERWKHIANEHPSISHEEIKNVLIGPIVIKPSKYDPAHVRWYYSFNKVKKLYLMVAVKYLNGEGFVITAYYMRNIK